MCKVAYLEVKVVLAVLVELGRSNVETNLDLASVAGLLDSLGKEVERLVGARNVGSKATLVTDVGSCTSASDLCLPADVVKRKWTHRQDRTSW